MEYKEVVGRRRTIRYFQSWRQVEREKIQIMLEAARLASCAVNATFLKAIVVIRDDIPRETLDAIKTPVSGLNIELAPVHIYTYADMGAYKGAQARLKKLVDVGALNATHGWSHKFVDEFVWPNILKPLSEECHSASRWRLRPHPMRASRFVRRCWPRSTRVSAFASRHSSTKHINKILKAPPEWHSAVGAAGRLSRGIVGGRWSASASAAGRNVLRGPIRETVQGRSQGHRANEGREDDPGAGAAAVA